DLTARLGVKRRAIQNDLGLVAGDDFIYLPAVSDERHDLRSRKLSAGVTGEFGSPASGDLLINGVDGLGRAALHRFTRALALFFKFGLEAILVEREAALRGGIFDQVVAQPVCVVELEDVRPRNDFTGGFLHHVFEYVQPGADRRDVEPLFGRHHTLDDVAGLAQFGIYVVELTDDEVGDFGEEDVFEPELVSVPYGAAHDLAQHVTARVIAGEDSVGDQEGRGARMVGDHS